MQYPRGPAAAPPRRSAPRQALPRVLAAACYSLPVVPSLYVLLRRRRGYFLRFHAAQALIFYGLVALAQVAIYLLLLLVGGMTHDLLPASLAGLVIIALFAALGLFALACWLRLVTDCIDGRAHKLRFVGDWAVRLERLTARS